MLRMIICKRCGRCCHYIREGKVKKCLYLIRLGNGVTSCRVYDCPGRVGKVIGKGVKCVNREDSPFDYDGCPYNSNKRVLVVGY